MTKIVSSLVLMLAIPFAHASVAGSPAKGSQEAAGQVVAGYLQGYYKGPKSATTALTVLDKTPESLTVQTRFREMDCTMKVVKNADANQFGWVVQQHQCGGTLR